MAETVRKIRTIPAASTTSLPGRPNRERNIYNALTLSGKVCVPFSSGAEGWLDTSFSRTIDWMVIIEELMRVINQLPCQ